jgi:sugar lactone lactonase YvrE
MEIELVGSHTSRWGEGPVWWQERLYYVDIEGQAVHRYDPATGEEKIWDVDERVGFVVPRKQGGLVLGGDNGLYFFDEASGEKTAIADPESEKADNRFNDAAVSPDGRLFAGTISTVKKEGDAALYVLEKSGEVRKVFGDVTNSNGIAWSPDGSRVYYIDTPRKEIWGFDYDVESGEWSNRKIVVKTDHIEASPDGMSMDAEGKVWVAFCHGALVARFDVDTGEELQRVDMPCVETTSCAWGGSELDVLYVTTGIHKSLIEQVPGRLFAVKGLGVKGLPTASFNG